MLKFRIRLNRTWLEIQGFLLNVLSDQFICLCLVHHQQIVIHLEILTYRCPSRISKQLNNVDKIQPIIVPLIRIATALAARSLEKKNCERNNQQTGCFSHWKYERIGELTELMTWKLSSVMQGSWLNLACRKWGCFFLNRVWKSCMVHVFSATLVSLYCHPKDIRLGQT